MKTLRLEIFWLICSDTDKFSPGSGPLLGQVPEVHRGGPPHLYVHVREPVRGVLVQECVDQSLKTSKDTVSGI